MNYQSESTNEIFAALAKAQGEMSAASKDCKNPFFNSRYADLASVWSACRDALSKNGICALQTTYIDADKEVYLKTTLGHGSGQWISSEIKLDIPSPGATEIDKYGKEKKINVMQALGSILTYQKRYQLSSIVGVAPSEDDDGNASSYTPAPQKVHEPKEPALAQIPAISTAQGNEIRSLIALCDADFTSKIMGYLSNNGMPNIDRMFVSFFEPIKKRIQKYLSDEAATEKVNDG